MLKGALRIGGTLRPGEYDLGTLGGAADEPFWVSHFANAGYRSGYYGRTLVARVGKLELRIPQDRLAHLAVGGFTATFESMLPSGRRLTKILDFFQRRTP